MAAAALEHLGTDNLNEARSYLPLASESLQVAFARRQLRARRRATVLLDFYRRYPCHLANLHLLAACAVALGRFAGFSAEFDEIGEEAMPVSTDGEPRSAAWQAYMEACDSGKPIEVRDELWIAAHMDDTERIRRAGLDQRFHEQAAAHSDDPTWLAINQHMEATLGTRLIDHVALEGEIAYETAFAQSLASTFLRLSTVSWRLVRRYYWEGFRAVLLPAGMPYPGIASYRRLALHGARYCVTAWSASRVYQRGMRSRDRGSRIIEEGWPLLADVLGTRINDIHPLIVRFYQNPARFDVKVKVELHTLPARLWSRVITLLIGQGPYQESEAEIDAQFRVFRRSDGSMHFLRELYMEGTLRVFDSDFVVRKVDGTLTLFEVFVDKHLDIEMTTTPLPDGGLSIRGRRIYYRGLRIPCPGLRVEFQSHVLTEEAADGKAEILQIEVPDNSLKLS